MFGQFNKIMKFHGDGGNLFNIYIINMLLTVFTLGIYYPWARAAMLRYTYQETEFAGSRFTFHGTGQEMFIGFLKGIGIIMGLYLILILGSLSGNFYVIILSFLLFTVGLTCFIPMAIHGAMRYRLSRTSWRGIHFAYIGDLAMLLAEYFSCVVLTIFTFGLYSSWMSIRIRTFVINNIRFGNLKLSYTGNGSDFFFLNLKGYFLTIFTIGIYFFWWMKESFDYFVDNLEIEQDGEIVQFQSTMTGSGYFGLMITNILMLVFTLGLASPWVTVRTLRYVFENVEIEDNFNPNTIGQSEIDYNQIKNDDIADILDIGIA